ncbi:MAG: FtsX-like permease family protein, partial [Acidobacteria bacterium]|nr:FtsX-like permease family protein [Acidobacteriota bacterium]
SGIGQNQDDTIVVPYTTVQKKLQGIQHLNRIFISARSGNLVPTAQKQIEELLRFRHKIEPGEEDDFTVRSISEMASVALSTTTILSYLLGSIASVSLIVGGIGIMNIMFVSVTERTREIGIRMAVGAKGSDILSQFLIEAVVLSSVGGVVGILVGVGASTLISRLFQWPTLIAPSAVALAFLFSAAVGIFFGFYPARKASRLDPIESLRYE